MKRLPLLLFIATATLICAQKWETAENYKGPRTRTTDTTWHSDILTGYEARYVDQGEAFDGPCRSTIVRKRTRNSSGRAFLYIHGFNDYFFQTEMGERFVDSGYHFYAVDLRRYGRSWQPWQYPFNVRDMKEYFADIDSALSQMRRDGCTDITLGGHSTGGLITAYFASCRGARVGVNRLVTDSPFLEWNFSAAYRHVLIPIVSLWSRISPSTKIKQARCDGYAYSLLKQFHGQWTYNTDWKKIYSPPVTASWIHAVNSSQSKLMKQAKWITIPVLVMHSNRKIDGCSWEPIFQTGDAVLDPAMIHACGEKLGHSP